MKISTLALLTVSLIGLGTVSVHAEEPERNTPEAILVPLELATGRHEVIIAADKAATAAENSVIHVDDNNRLVGLSN